MVKGEKGDKKLLLGNEAIARGAIEGGLQAIAAYPGTPSSEIPDTLRKYSDHFGYYMEYATNEKTALETAMSASWSGLRSMAVMKHVGLNVASDSFMSLAHTGVKGGLVLTVADDPSMWSSQNEQDTRNYAKFANVPLLDPSSPQEAKEMANYAFKLSEKVELPVILRPTTRISHTRGDVEFSDVPEIDYEGNFEKNTKRWVTTPANARKLKPKLLKRKEEARNIFEESDYNWVEGDSKSDVGVIASGISYDYVKEALGWMQDEVKLLKLGTPYPLPKERIAKYLKNIEKVLIVEELDPIVEEAIRILVQRRDIDIEISGKMNDIVPMNYEMSTKRAAKSLSKYLDTKTPIDFEDLKEKHEKINELLVPRPPELCPGCPHDSVFRAMKNVLGDDAIYPSDIGCYTLGVNEPLNAVDTTFAMGGSTGFASGMPNFNDKPVVATVGDSTFFHSGISGMLSAIYNNSNTTIIVLDNRVTAMTGHQPAPSTGWTAVEEKTDLIPIEDIADAAGAEFVEVVDSYQTEEVEDKIEKAVETEGVSVIVARQPCVLFRQEFQEKSEQLGIKKE